VQSDWALFPEAILQALFKCSEGFIPPLDTSAGVPPCTCPLLNVSIKAFRSLLQENWFKILGDQRDASEEHVTGCVARHLPLHLILKKQQLPVHLPPSVERKGYWRKCNPLPCASIHFAM